MDGKFSREFDQVFEDNGVEVVKVGPRRPVMNAYAERWIGSIRRECLDHFIVFGETHPRHLISEYVDTYYNDTRPHQGRDILPPPLTHPPPEWKNPSLEEITPEELLGGLLTTYRRQQAA